MAKLVRRQVGFSGTRSVTGPFTWGQRQIWRDIQLMPDAAFYNVSQVLLTAEGLQLDDVLDQLTALLGRHESLRTLFGADDAGDLRQRVLAKGEVEVEVLLADSDTDHDIVGLFEEEERRLVGVAFDNAVEVPFRALIGVLDGMPRVLILCVSHLAADLLSVRILVDELSAALTALIAGRRPPEVPTSRQPIDQAEWERSAEGIRRMDKALHYWAGQLSTVPPS
ncbi:Condensation domain-containing protein, partial [Streptosporangium subroseum]